MSGAQMFAGNGFGVNEFVENFEVIAGAAGSLEHLRGLIINLAIRGRLGTRNPADASARALVESAARELGGRRQPRTLDVAARATFDLPSGWVWSQPQELGVVSPRNKVDDDVLAGFVPMTNVPTDYRQAVVPDARPWKEIKKGYTHVADGDIAVAKITPCFQNGKSCVMRGLPNGVGAGTTELLVLRAVKGAVEPNYLLLFFKSPDFITRGLGLMTGTAGQQRVPTEYFAAVPVPLPPLAEQKRIVAKVDQLMALCDELEARQTKKRETRTRLTKSALEALAAAEDWDGFDAAWAKVIENFDVLLDSGEKVKQMRIAVRDLAVSGRLSRRDVGPRVAADRRDGPFAVPERWNWVPLGDLVVRTEYGTSQKAHEQPEGVPVLRMNNIQDGRLELASLKYVPATTQNLQALMLLPGDLLFNRTNSRELVGKMAVFREREQYTFASYLIRVRLDASSADPEYVNLYFGSGLCRRTQIEPNITCETNQANFNGTKLKEILVPTPSLREQQAIVARVARLMEMCDALELTLRRSEDLAARLTVAAVKQVLV